MMKPIIVALSMLVAGSAMADTSSCQKSATDKKLAGAALTSFMSKCETDAKLTCAKTAGDQKLAGAAKLSFEKKCLEDATGQKVVEKK